MWNVEGAEDITEESLSLFTILDPKIDVLVVGYGDNTPVKGTNKKFPVDPTIILKMRQKGVSMELLTTENAIATYNYLVEEGRVVAQLLFPPTTSSSRTRTSWTPRPGGRSSMGGRIKTG